MNLLEKILNNKIIQIISLIAGISGTGLALKEYLFSNPELQATIDSETKLLQQNNVEDVKISIKNNEINPEKEEIIIRTITIKNSGGDSILENYYDSESSWGIHISDSKIIKAIQSDANNEYFKSKPLRINAEKVEIPKYIIEPGESITISTISIEPQNNKSQISLFGKVAKTKITELAILENQPEGTFTKATRGDLAVQATRTIIYFFVFILSILIPTSIITIIGETFTKRRNESLSKNLAKIHEDKNAEKIISELKEGHIKKIAWLQEEMQLLSEENLPLTTSILKLIASNKNPPPELKRTADRIIKLKEFEVIKFENNKTSINKDALEIIKEAHESIEKQID